MTTFAATGALARDLRATMRGSVIAAGDPGYDEARAPHTVNVDQRPAAVVVPKDAADVAAVVRAAAAAGLRVTAQAGGHGATSAMEDCVLIRTHELRDVEVDVRAASARVGAGVRWGELHEVTARHGLHGVCGSAPDISIAGYCLGGGISWFARALGSGAGSVLAIEVVDGDGTRSRLTPDRDPEAFWALRGGAGSLAVVTALEVRLHRAPAIFGGLLTWSGEHARDVLGAWRRWVETVGEEVTSMATVMHVPPLPTVPPELRGRCVVRVGVSVLGDETWGREVVAPLRAAAPVLIDDLRPTGIDELGTLAQEPPMPLPAQLDGTLLTDVDEATLDRLVALAGPESGTPLAFVQLRHLGGALARDPETPSVFGAVPEPFFAYALGAPLGGPGARRGDRRSAARLPHRRGPDVDRPVPADLPRRRPGPWTGLPPGRRGAPGRGEGAARSRRRRDRQPPPAGGRTVARATPTARGAARAAAHRPGTQRGPRRHGALSSHHDWTCTDGPTAPGGPDPSGPSAGGPGWTPLGVPA